MSQSAPTRRLRFEVRPSDCAPKPAVAPLLRDRVGTGIGQRGRFIASPEERRALLTAAQYLDLPATLQPPRPGFPLIVQCVETKEKEEEADNDNDNDNNDKS